MHTVVFSESVIQQAFHVPAPALKGCQVPYTLRQEGDVTDRHNHKVTSISLLLPLLCLTQVMILVPYPVERTPQSCSLTRSILA